MVSQRKTDEILMKIYLSCSGEGFGQATRMAAAAIALKREGHSIFPSTYGTSAYLLRKMGLKIAENLPEFQMVGDGGFDFLSSVHSSVFSLLRINRSVEQEVRFIQNSGAQLVIADNRYSAAIAGKKLDLPVIYVTNQTHFPLSGFPLDLQEMRRSMVGKLLTPPALFLEHYADAILIPDFFPPDSICLPLVTKSYQLTKKTRFIGPLSNHLLRKHRKINWNSVNTKVFATVGGHAFQDYPQLKELISSAADFDFIFTSPGLGKSVRSGNAHFRGLVTNVSDYQASADLLLMSAGHSGIMESIILGKQALLIPDYHLPEQVVNARRYKQLGFGDYIGSLNLGILESKLTESVLWNNSRRKRIQRLSNLAVDKMNGPANLVSFCQEFTA